MPEKRDVRSVPPDTAHTSCQPESHHLVRPSSLGGFPGGPHKVQITASWCNQWGLAIWRGNYLALRMGVPLSTSTLSREVGLSGLCCPSCGMQAELPAHFLVGKKSDQLLGWCPCQLASGDMREKTSSLHSLEIRQARPLCLISVPLALSHPWLICCLPGDMHRGHGDTSREAFPAEQSYCSSRCCSVCILVLLRLPRPQIAHFLPESQSLKESWNFTQFLPQIVPVCP